MKEHSNNSVGTHVKRLKTFLKWAYNVGLHSCKDYERFKALFYEIEVVYLTRQELNKLAELDLSKSKYLEPIRDVFLFA